MLDKNKKFDSAQPVFALGRQLTLEYEDCSPQAFLDKASVETVLLDAARDSGATIISSSFHQFEPQGISGVVIIAESHFTIHAWPEHNYAAVDIFTCGDNIDLDVAIAAMQKGFASKRVFVSSDQNRGLLRPKDDETATPVQGSQGQICDRNILPISWKKAYDTALPWAVLTSVDLYHCDPDAIKNPGYIEQFAIHVCDKIGVKPSGNCQVVAGGEGTANAGFSMTQLMETALISGHFANATHSAYLDIFSCAFYEPRDLAEFALSFFKAEHYKMQMTLRQ